VSPWQPVIDKIILFKDHNNISDKEFYKFWSFIGKNFDFISIEYIKKRIENIDGLFKYGVILYGVYTSYEDKLNYFLQAFKGKKITINIHFYSINTRKKKIVCVFFSFMKKNYILGIFENIVQNIECLKDFKILSHSLDFQIYPKMFFSEIHNIDDLNNQNIIKIFHSIKINYSSDYKENFLLFENLIKKITRVEVLHHLQR
jgi:hypothetical protein